jgi:hypothetical protein
MVSGRVGFVAVVLGVALGASTVAVLIIEFSFKVIYPIHESRGRELPPRKEFRNPALIWIELILVFVKPQAAAHSADQKD